MTDSPPEKVSEDHLYAASCAMNLLLYEADPGSRTTMVGGPGEHHTITRREALIDIYARLLLLKVKGETPRLVAIAAEARRRMLDPELLKSGGDFL